MDLFLQNWSQILTRLVVSRGTSAEAWLCFTFLRLEQHLWQKHLCMSKALQDIICIAVSQARYREWGKQQTDGKT